MHRYLVLPGDRNQCIGGLVELLGWVIGGGEVPWSQQVPPTRDDIQAHAKSSLETRQKDQAWRFWRRGRSDLGRGSAGPQHASPADLLPYHRGSPGAGQLGISGGRAFCCLLSPTLLAKETPVNYVVGREGIEPSRLSTLAPKTSASTSSATCPAGALGARSTSGGPASRKRKSPAFAGLLGW